MYLKSIELQGFKSFANTTTLNFEKGITGIVGPNGSGKSNIADAVRWVLGERSMKQLRGSDSLDVIFSGTELRKAQPFAYVCLTIDNSDHKLPFSYNEVSVSKRLYRNGMSEYKLNGVECRLKDVVEMFYDTGIGKEGYSIIGQGQIEKILSNKPEDRRELFDEAVGIVKYKRRKLIAERKLDEERLNLSRVTDIINEIERQIGPLKKQAEAAREYVAIRDDLLLYESNYFIREVDALSNATIEATENLNTIRNDIKNINQEKAAFNERYAEVDNLISKLDLEVSDLKDKINENTTLIESLKGQISVFNEQINGELQNSKDRMSRIESIEKNIKSNIDELITAFNTINVLGQQISLIKDNTETSEYQFYTFDDDLKLIENTKNETREIFTKHFSDGYDENSIIDTSINVFDEGSSSSTVDDKRDELANIENKIKDINNNILSFNNNIIENEKKYNSLVIDINEKQNQYHSAITKLDTIKNLLERYEGYNNTVKLILDKKKEFKGLIGAVADIIETKKEYETAIEVALGGAIQNIVTEDIDCSKNIINYLKTNKLGRVTTLPLTTINNKDAESYHDLLSEKGVIDLAYKLTKYDKKYENLSKFLLERCIIVDTFDNAKILFNKYNSKIKIVTLDGELFNPGGAISGGAYKNSSTLIGRKREYEELSIYINEQTELIKNLDSNKNKLFSDINLDRAKLEKLKIELNELNIEKNTMSLSIINDMRLRYSTLSNKAQFIKTDISRIINVYHENINEKITYESVKTNSSGRLTDIKANIESTTRQIEDLNALVSDLNLKVISKQEEKNNNLSRSKEFFDAKDRLVAEQIRLEQELTKNQNVIERSNEKIAEITNDMMDKYELTYVKAKEQYKEDFGTLEQIYAEVRKKRKIISDLGPINIDAIEEYEKTGERFKLLSTQYEDIKKSEEMIADIVRELDENMHRQFEENFAKIKEQFQIVFTKLFGGGKANLEIVDTVDKNELEAGISIIVQPPGKKLGNMMQLSGGEKSLTAIALMFAIQNLKPSPFCLLDEIEAALDESNVDRFADYLTNLTCNTQFIIITHRRGTMEKADRLYGITMQEKGVTALVSVDLIEDKLS